MRSAKRATRGEQIIPQLNERGRFQTALFEQFALVEHFLRRAFHDEPSFRKDEDPVAAKRFFHKLRNHDDRHAAFAVKSKNGGEHFLAPPGVEHGGRFVEHEHLRLHGEKTRNGDALFLPAGKRVARLFA